MLKLRHSTLVFISGLIWLIVGCILLPLGLNFIVSAMLVENRDTLSHPVLDFLAPSVGGIDQAGLIWIICMLAVGFIKGRFIFSKAVTRGVDRIRSFPNPTSLLNLYSKAYLMLLAGMFFLGYLVKFLPIDIRGGVDVFVGAALINGSVLYFRKAWMIKQDETTGLFAKQKF